MQPRSLLRSTLLFSLGLAWLALAACQAIPAATPVPTSDPNDLAGLEIFTDLSAEHISGTYAYPQTPPAGGPHNPFWQNCGFYDQPVPNEQAVHSLEHAAVWITYQPDLAADEVTVLRDLVRGQSHLLVSPFPGLPAPVVASAWGAQIKLDGAADPRLPVFINRYLNSQAAPEPGAPCSSSVGEPLE